MAICNFIQLHLAPLLVRKGKVWLHMLFFSSFPLLLLLWTFLICNSELDVLSWGCSCWCLCHHFTQSQLTVSGNITFTSLFVLKQSFQIYWVICIVYIFPFNAHLVLLFKYASPHSSFLLQKKSREESCGEGSGVEILENKPYTDGPGGTGQYTHKVYHIGMHIPSWFRSILPKAALRVEEESWNAYPYTRTRWDQLTREGHLCTFDAAFCWHKDIFFSCWSQ